MMGKLLSVIAYPGQGRCGSGAGRKVGIQPGLEAGPLQGTQTSMHGAVHHANTPTGMFL